QTVARGIYFYQLVTGEDTQVKKMIHSSAFSRADGINGGLFKTRTFSNLSQMLNTTTYSIEITSNHSTNPRIKRKEMNYIDVDDGVELSFMVSKDFTIGYLLYVGYQKGYIEIYDTEEYKVVDTVNGFEIEPWDIEVIDGGAKIYVCTKRGQLNSTGKIYSVNMETKESKIICNKSSEIFLRSDQTPFVVSEDPFITQRYLGIIDTKTDSIQWIDTLDIYPVGLSSSGLVFGPGDSILYCLNNDYYLFQYNYKLKKIIYEYSNYSFHFNQNLAIDINGSYLYSGVGQTFNLIYDSLYTNFYYSNFNGKIAISKDGSFVATSDPANSYDITVLPSGKIAFTYDLPNSPIQTLVNVSTRAHPSRSKRTDQIYLTDDSKKAFVSNWSKEIFVIDVAEKIISDVIVFNKGYGYGPITLIKKTN
ncbi:MAG: hypothetical protein K9I99_16145, partial [Melioribacteraceae bacterium]|nr:hypothetical protein [Melioribacteraceae bacterium]